MNPEIRKEFERRTKIVKALAHPSRLFIVDQLTHGRRCVCELTEMIGVDISTVSKHLSLLRRAGLVIDHRQGARVFYSLTSACIPRFFDCLEQSAPVIETAPATETEPATELCACQ